MNDIPIRWTRENFAGKLDNRWTFNNASINSNGVLRVGAGGSATLVLTEEVDLEFKYVQLKTKYTSLALSQENNYRNKPTLYIQEVYKTDKDIDTVKFRSLGFTTFNNSDGLYFNDKIYATLDRPMAKMVVTIKNETDVIFELHSLEMFQSVDLPEKQVSRVLNTAFANSTTDTVIPYFDESGRYMTGFGVLMPGGATELKFGYGYFNGVMVSIDTNFGQSVSVFPVTGVPDLSNTDTVKPPDTPPEPEI